MAETHTEPLFQPGAPTPSDAEGSASKPPQTVEKHEETTSLTKSAEEVTKTFLIALESLDKLSGRLKQQNIKP